MGIRWQGEGGRKARWCGPAVHIRVGHLVDTPILAHETHRMRQCFIKSQLASRKSRTETVRCERTQKLIELEDMREHHCIIRNNHFRLGCRTSRVACCWLD